MDRVQPRGRTMRLLAAGAVLIALTAGLRRWCGNSTSRNCPASGILALPARSAGGRGLSRADQHRRPQRGHAAARLSSPGLSESKDAHAGSDHDLTLLVSHDNTLEEVKLAAGDHIASATFEVDLNEGSVALIRWTPMWRGSASSSWTESLRSGSRSGSRCGRGRSGTICIRRASPGPIRMTFS